MSRMSLLIERLRHSNAQFETWYLADANGRSTLTTSKHWVNAKPCWLRRTSMPLPQRKSCTIRTMALRERAAALAEQEVERANRNKVWADREGALSIKEDAGGKVIDDREAASLKRKKSKDNDKALEGREAVLIQRGGSLSQ